MRILLIIALTFVVAVALTEQPRRIEQSRDGTVRLNASNAVVHGTTIRYEPQPHKNTIGFWTKAEDWVSWGFTLHTPGEFTVEMLQSCGKGSGGSTYVLAVGDQKIEDTVPDTGSFTNWVRRPIGTIKLAEAGQHTLTVKPLRKPGLAVMDLRSVVLKPAGGKVPNR
jgi:arylsulfatase A